MLFRSLQETADKAESNARVHEHKAQKMTDVYAKAKGENKNLYIANKKLWKQNKNTWIGFFLEHSKEKANLSK